MLLYDQFESTVKYFQLTFRLRNLTRVKLEKYISR